jgi:hypothetical protein
MLLLWVGYGTAICCLPNGWLKLPDNYENSAAEMNPGAKEE